MIRTMPFLARTIRGCTIGWITPWCGIRVTGPAVAFITLRSHPVTERSPLSTTTTTTTRYTTTTTPTVTGLLRIISRLPSTGIRRHYHHHPHRYLHQPLHRHRTVTNRPGIRPTRYISSGRCSCPIPCRRPMRSSRPKNGSCTISGNR